MRLCVKRSWQSKTSRPALRWSKPFVWLLSSFWTTILSCDLASANEHTPKRLNEFERCTTEKHGTAFNGAQCTSITINTSPTGTLNVLRTRARSTPKSDPLIVITGGPGSSAVAAAWQYLRFFNNVQKARDIIFIDQRGTGKSAEFNCETVANIDSTLPTQKLVQATNNALIECAKTYDSNQHSLQSLSTHQAAKDIEQVRTALGYDTVNLWGSSYGTRVAMEYQRLYPHLTRTVIIDGVAPGAIALPRYAEHDASAALKRVFDICDLQLSCQQAFGNLGDKWQQLLADLERSPVNTKLSHPRTEELEPVTITAALASNWVRFALYSRELSALLPLAIFSASQGDFDRLANLAQIASDSVSDGMSYGMHAAILCAEDQHAPTIQRADIAHLPPLPFSELNDLNPACKAMPNIEPSAIEFLFTPVSSDVPTLVLSGQFDPVTPASWGEWASQKMTNARHIIVPGGHHGVSGLGCIPDIIAGFIEQGSNDNLHAECSKNIQPVDFFIDNAGPALEQHIDNSPSSDAIKEGKID